MNVLLRIQYIIFPIAIKTQTSYQANALRDCYLIKKHYGFHTINRPNLIGCSQVGRKTLSVYSQDDVDTNRRLETTESENVEFIDNLLDPNHSQVGLETQATESNPGNEDYEGSSQLPVDQSKYFDRKKIGIEFLEDEQGPEQLANNDDSKIQKDSRETQSLSNLVNSNISESVVTSIDSEGKKTMEVGDRPIISGSGMDMQFRVEDYPLNVDSGRYNEWPAAWNPGSKVLSFFPILIDEYSLHPSPLQIGFEDAIRFRGKHVESTFNSLIDQVERGDSNLQLYGMCFINPSTSQLAPLAVYAELISKKAFVDGGGESLEVKGRVLGRVMISQVVLEEPFIKAIITPIEDKPDSSNREEVAKLVDEITYLHQKCNDLEETMMKLMEQPYAVERIRARPNLHDVINDRLEKFGIDVGVASQAFAQLAAYTAFDYHLTAYERYNSLAMQNSMDRLLYVRDILRTKMKQLQILQGAPKERIMEMMRQIKSLGGNVE